MPRIPIGLRTTFGRMIRWWVAAPLLAAFAFSFGVPVIDRALSLDQTIAFASPLGSDPAQRGGPPDGVPNGPPDGVPNGPPSGVPPAVLPPVFPSATPELGSIALFGTGAAGIAEYVLTRARAGRRRS
jgi:hypothetical protein